MGFLALGLVVVGGLLFLGLRVSGSALRVNSSTQVDQGLLELQLVFLECLCEGKADLVTMARMLGVTHSYLCDVVFEHGLTVTVGDVLAAAGVWAAAYATEIFPQAVAAPDNLRARSGEEEKMPKEKWSPPQKKK